jgi:hypothetical protein
MDDRTAIFHSADKGIDIEKISLNSPNILHLNGIPSLEGCDLLALRVEFYKARSNKTASTSNEQHGHDQGVPLNATKNTSAYHHADFT